MEEGPVKKISVADICEKCDMNRKSFYYHFKDKYDLVNWIFDSEFLAMAREHAGDDRWEFIERMCHYFYDNRSFYHKVLQIKGQNSFSEHFREFIRPLLRNRAEEIMQQDNVPTIYVDFATDGIACTFERWLLDKECMTAEEFVLSIRNLLQILAKSVDWWQT